VAVVSASERLEWWHAAAALVASTTPAESPAAPTCAAGIRLLDGQYNVASGKCSRLPSATKRLTDFAVLPIVSSAAHFNSQHALSGVDFRHDETYKMHSADDKRPNADSRSHADQDRGRHEQQPSGTSQSRTVDVRAGEIDAALDSDGRADDQRLERSSLLSTSGTHPDCTATANGSSIIGARANGLFRVPSSRLIAATTSVNNHNDDTFVEPTARFTFHSSARSLRDLQSTQPQCAIVMSTGSARRQHSDVTNHE